MEQKKWTRRQVIGSLAIIPFAAKSAVLSTPPIIRVSDEPVKCKLLNAKGEPFDPKNMDRFYICDLLSRPFVINPVFSPGEIDFNPVNIPFRISLPVLVPGFGEVFLYADNRGKGYTAESLQNSGTLFLNYEFAADRLATIHRLMQECKSAGITLSSDTLKRITDAENFFSKCEEANTTNKRNKNDKEVAKWAFESLRESLYGGEMVVLDRARQKIEKTGGRPGFLFGCNAFGFRDADSQYAKYFESLFNYGTVPFYMSSTQRQEGQFNYSRVEPVIEALQKTQIVPKGHPLIFLTPTTPEWVWNKPFSEVKQICLDYINHTILKFRGRIHVWDVINEAHVQPDVQYGEGFIPNYTKDDAVELSCAASEMAHKADPTCFRVVNCTGTWSDYYMGRKHAPWQQTAYDYLQMLEDAGCDYDAIGLQYYHSGRDILEFERDIDRFAKFNKRIHVTELQIPSSSADVPNGDWWGGGIGGARLPWHGTEFTEAIQAEWVEDVYTMLYSKSYLDAITWWDMKDPAFVPHGGFFNADMTPKESYSRLKSLLDKWKSM